MLIKQNSHYSWKIALGVAVILIVPIVYFGWKFTPRKEDAYLTTALIILCIAVGWAIGTMLSPDSRPEKRMFFNVCKGVSLFASGYLISKADPMVTAILKPDLLTSDCGQLTAFRLTACLATVIAVTITVYILRIYLFTVGEVTQPQ